MTTASLNSIDRGYASLAKATIGVTVTCYALALLFVASPESSNLSAAGEWVIISELDLIEKIVGIPRLFVTLAYVFVLASALNSKHDSKDLLYASRAAVLFVALPDIANAMTLFMRATESYCEESGAGLFIAFSSCPEPTERPACMALALLWLLKSVLTGLSWRAAEALPRSEN